MAVAVSTEPGSSVTLRALGRDLRLETRWVGAPASAHAPVVFLHEGLGSVALWRDFPQRFCERHGLRGLVYSRFGYGRSTPRPHVERFPVTFMHREAREVLPALLDALDIERAWLFGHSDGGSIALLAAAALPERTAGVVALAPHVFVEDAGVASIAATRETYLHGRLRERLSRHHDDVDSAFWGWNDVWLDPAFRTWNIEGELDAITCPLMVVQGEDDEYGTLEQVRRIERRLPKTRLLILPECGHSPHRDQPQTLTDQAGAFIVGGGR